MANQSKPSLSADQIADMATRGEDVSMFFSNQFTVVRPVKRVNVDLSQGMLRELDARAAHLNVSRQAVIKTLLRQALDHSEASCKKKRKIA
jgi:ABC-type microcin C transport system duplicated ATPase subunit YejF